MTDENEKVLIAQIRELQDEVSVLRERVEPRIWGMTDRMMERVAWFLIVVAILLLTDNAETLSEMMHAIFGAVSGG